MHHKSTIIFFGVVSLLLIVFASTTPVKVVRGYAQSALLPLAGASYKTVDTTSSATSILGSIKDLALENNQLKTENEILQAQVIQLKEVRERPTALEKEVQLQATNF